jgi:N-acyl amino acid synthase of PEP-CTERM/exosortase system
MAEDKKMHEHMKRIRFVEVDSEFLKREIFKLRYDVYVSEFGFEKKEAHPSGLEKDIYDPHSVELAAIEQTDAETQIVIGTIRLILHSEHGFPIENAAPINFTAEKPPIDKIAEISRLAIRKDYRRRHGDGLYGVKSYTKASEEETSLNPDSSQNVKVRIQPYLILGLFKEMYHVSKKLGITHWYMITEKKLWYALKRFDLIFSQIGEPVDYHGLRIPYLGIIEEIEKNLMKNHMGFYQDFLVGLDKEYWPAQLR